MRNTLQAHRHSQIARTFKNIKETKRIVERLRLASIEVIPYKGLLMLQNYYNHRQLRESADIDLLIMKKDLPVLVEVLSSDGYRIKDIDPERTHVGGEKSLLTQLSDSAYYNELTLIGRGIAVDVHWEMSRNLYQSTYPVEGLILRSRIGHFYHSSIRLPSNEDQFAMMVHHHGSKEKWQRLKYLVDLHFALLALKEKIDEERTIKLLEQYGLVNALQMGLHVLDAVGLGHPRSEQVNAVYTMNLRPSKSKLSTFVRIVKASWEHAEDWYGMGGSKRALIRYHRMLLYHSGNTFSKRIYIKKLLEAYLTPNDYETPRLITFPKRFRTLNLISKIVTYLFSRT